MGGGGDKRAIPVGMGGGLSDKIFLEMLYADPYYRSATLGN